MLHQARGAQTTCRECKGGDGIKKFEKHCFRGTRSSIEMLKGYMTRESLGTPSLAKLTFFIQRCCEPVHVTICSAKTLIFHRCKGFVAGLVTVQVPTKNTSDRVSRLGLALETRLETRFVKSRSRRISVSVSSSSSRDFA